MKRLTHKLLLELLEYNPATGILVRKVQTASRVVVGDEGGWIDKDGYVCISLLNKTWKAHRLAWFYMTGRWPKADIDHENRIRSDNKWSNLRDASRSRNLANAAKCARNTSGLKGASRLPYGMWRATISVGNKSRHLGSFDCPAAAHFAYFIEAHKIHGEFARAA